MRTDRLFSVKKFSAFDLGKQTGMKRTTPTSRGDAPAADTVAKDNPPLRATGKGQAASLPHQGGRGNWPRLGLIAVSLILLGGGVGLSLQGPTLRAVFDLTQL